MSRNPVDVLEEWAKASGVQLDPAKVAEWRAYCDQLVSFSVDYVPAPDPRIVRCKACGAAIIFLPTKNGKQCPADAATVQLTDREFKWGTHTSHFATCPKASEFRRPRASR